MQDRGILLYTSLPCSHTSNTNLLTSHLQLTNVNMAGARAGSAVHHRVYVDALSKKKGEQKTGFVRVAKKEKEKERC